jgi:hypothetical protein
LVDQRGPIGGAAAEAGSAHRAGAAAIALVHGLCRTPLTRLFPHAGPADGDAVPFSVQMEVDHPVDDLLVVSETGRRSYVQAKADRRPRRALLDALKQWVGAVADGGAQDDTLVLCTAYSAASLDHLSSALIRLRDPFAQALSSHEQAAVGEFTRDILALRPNADTTGVRDEILRRCVIWHDDCGGSDSPAVLAACTMLGSTLGGYDKGRTAFSLLRAKISDLALLRSGLDVDQARALLGEAGLVPTGPVSTSIRSALVKYRTVMRDRARELVIPGLPLDVPPLPAVRLLDNLRVRCRGFVDSEYEPADAYGVVPLTVVARRVPRILLLGVPGIGKTTALIHLAAAAAGQAAAPMPIMVRLGKLADRLKNEREVEIADHVLVEAMDVPTLDTTVADLVRREALERIRAGSALVMLDALDETGDIRRDVARALRSWLDTVHDDLRVIVTSRDTAYSSAAVLGFTEAELGTPFDLNDTVSRVVKHAADWSGRPDRDDDISIWLAKRQWWLRTAVGEHWEMLDIPLYAMHIAALAVATRFSDLPPNNALALKSVVESLWLRWEAGVRRQGADPLPGLPDRNSSAEAFNSTFSLITDQLNDGGKSVDSLVGTIARHLEADYGSPLGLARTSARQLVAMWDDAGLFVAGGPDAVVTARTRLLIDLGRAIRISTMAEEEKEARVRELTGNVRQLEIVLFVVAFDHGVRELVTRMAVEEKDIQAALVLASAYRRHPSEFGDCVRGAVEALIAGILDEECSQFVSAALTLAHLPVPEVWQDKVRWAALWRLPPVWGAIFDAIAANDWAVREANPGQLAIDLPDVPPRPPAVDPEDIRWRLSAFHTVLMLEQPPEPDVELSDLEWSIEPGYALLKSAEAMVSVDPDVVPKARMSPLVRDAHTALHVDMLAADHAGVPRGSAAAQPQMGSAAVLRRDMAALASVILALAEASTGDPQHGDWSLDVIVEVLRVADMHQRRPGVIADIISQGRDTLISLLHDVAAFLGFSPQELANSAASCTEILTQEAINETVVDYQWSAILYGGGPEWIGPDVPYRIDTTADDGGRRQQALDHIISVALSDDPIALYAAGILLPRLGSSSPVMVAGTLRYWLTNLDSREFIQSPSPLSILVCDLDIDAVAELRKSPNPSIRWGVLNSVTHRVACEGATELRGLLESLASDPDMSVRFSMLDHVERRHDGEVLDDLKDWILAKLSEPAKYWSCIGCGTSVSRPKFVR